MRYVPGYAYAQQSARSQWARCKAYPGLPEAYYDRHGACFHIRADCCDGTDEKPSVGCKNTCLEKGAHERDAVRQKAKDMERSLQLKQQLIEQSVERKADWSTRASELPMEVSQQEHEITRLEGTPQPPSIVPAAPCVKQYTEGSRHTERREAVINRVVTSACAC